MKYERVPVDEHSLEEGEDGVVVDKEEVNAKEGTSIPPPTYEESEPNDATTSEESRPVSLRQSRIIRLVGLLAFVLAIYVIFFADNDSECIDCNPRKPMHSSSSTPDSDQANAQSSYIQLVTLPGRLVPSKVNPNKDRKLVVIGDVHGMKNELQELLRKLDNKGFLANSHVVFAGDMVQKGPNPLEVLDIAIAMNASCVRGNHEDTIMGHYHRLRKEGKIHTSDTDKDDYPNQQSDTTDDDSKISYDSNTGEEEKKEDKERHDTRDPKKKKQKKPKHGKQDGKDRKHKHESVWKEEEKLAKSLKKRHIKYIDSCPLILKMDDVTGIGDVAVVHAGMVPGVDLAYQKPSVLMNIRTFINKLPSSSRKGVHWSRLWNEYQRFAVKHNRKPLTVVYGHDAKRGLEIKPYSKGLDSNCVRGGRLSAFVIRGGKHPKTQVISVKCRKYA